MPGELENGEERDVSFLRTKVKVKQQLVLFTACSSNTSQIVGKDEKRSAAGLKTFCKQFSPRRIDGGKKVLW